jgi:2-polyprenyl-3-methyl-5-hydroxy-6-metoxy-1,4-benzoquinol methylase
VNNGLSSSPVCHVCGSTETSPQFRISAPANRSGEFFRCARCGFLSFRFQPGQAAYEEDYYGEGDAKFGGITGRLRRHFAQDRARRTLRITGRPCDCFDIGCGDGDYLFELDKLGFRTRGSELPGPAFRRAEARLPGRISASGTAISEVEDGSLDLVSLWQVFEHIPEPTQLISTIGRKLRPGGWLVIAVPNPASWQARIFGASWLHLDPPRHLHLSSPENLFRLLEQSGFSVEHRHNSCLEFGPIGVIQSLYNALGLPRDEFFEQLRSNTSPGSGTEKIGYLSATMLLIPPALVFSLAESSLGSPVTYELWARRRVEGS